jgi:hypothetical protein
MNPNYKTQIELLNNFSSEYYILSHFSYLTSILFSKFDTTFRHAVQVLR